MVGSSQGAERDPDDHRVRCIDCKHHSGTLNVPIRRLVGGEYETTWRKARVCTLGLGSHPTILRDCLAFKPRFYTADTP